MNVNIGRAYQDKKQSEFLYAKNMANFEVFS